LNYPFAAQVVAEAHQDGGLAAFCHPFGTSDQLVTQSQQDAARQAVAQQLLGNNACNVDIIEVGYRARGGASLESHLALWDTLSRNGLYLTGSGVNDNHEGSVGTWATEANRFVTTAYATSTTDSALLSALAAGDIFVSESATFNGQVDLVADQVANMGAVLVQPGVVNHTVKVTAAGVPIGGSVELVQGIVDYAGTANPNPDTTVIASFPAAQFATGSVNTTWSAPGSVFVRTAVLDSTGRRIAFSNPIWLLSEPSRTPVPNSRGGRATPYSAAIRLPGSARA
jgi:hypothetical protein